MNISNGKIALWALVRKDVLIFLKDRRAVMLSFVTPLFLAWFMGALMGGASDEGPKGIPIMVVDQDQSTLSRSILDAMKTDSTLMVETTSDESAQNAVRRGRVGVAVVVPKGFGDAAPRAFFGGGDKPELVLRYDPSHTAELGMVRGILTQHLMQAVSKTAFSANGPNQNLIREQLARLDQAGNDIDPETRATLKPLFDGLNTYYDRLKANEAKAKADPNAAEAKKAAPEAAEFAGGGFSVPFKTREEALTAASSSSDWDSGNDPARRKAIAYGHTFAGMGVQFILFAAIEQGIGILTERRLGLWRRLRAAPVSRWTILLSRALSGTFIALMVFGVLYTFGAIFFGVPLTLGGLPGLVLVALAYALMSACFALMLAAVGRSPEATRGLTIPAVLVMVLVGGAWMPSFLFPSWVRSVGLALPTRWGVDGLEAATWRGLGFEAALMPALALLGFAVVFAGIAAWRFRWDAE